MGVFLRSASADAEEKKLRAVLCGVFTHRTPDPQPNTYQLPLLLSFGGLQFTLQLRYPGYLRPDPRAPWRRAAELARARVRAGGRAET